jgi:archaellum component FlaC
MEGMNFGTLAALIASTAAVIGAVYAIKGGKRADSKKAADDAQALTRIETTLGGVSKGIDEIKLEIGTHRSQLTDHEKRLTKIETRYEMRGE